MNTEELQEKVEQTVEVVDSQDNRNYSILVEVIRGTDTEASKSTITIYADTPTNASILLARLRDMYNNPDVKNVKLVGIYKRIQLSVVEGEKA